MHPFLAQPRRLFWYALAWLVAGLILAWVLVELQQTPWQNALVFSLPMLQLYGFLLTSAYYVCRSLPLLQRSAARVLGLFSGATLLSVVVWISLCLLWNYFLGDGEYNSLSVNMNRQLILILFAGACVLYVISLLAHDVMIAFDNIRSAEQHQAASQLLARDAELQMLRSQINPHFLFNSLNAISALTAMDAPAARNMAIELANFYRKTLLLSSQQFIPLAEELELCQHYVAIEKIRFGKKLQVEFTVEQPAFTAQVPALFLQPLIENAIKHGICLLDDGGTIVVTAAVKHGWLYIAVNNPIDPIDDFPSRAEGAGIGLANFKARMQNLYQANGRAQWHKQPNQFQLELIIPFSVATGGINA